MLNMFQSLLSWSPSLWVALLVVSIILVFINFYPRPPFPAKAPELVTENYPIVGALTFFTKRWEFHHRAALQSKTGNFSYYAGPNLVIGLSGDAGREAFFGSSQLGLSEGSEDLMLPIYISRCSWATDTPSSLAKSRASRRAERMVASLSTSSSESRIC